MLSKMMDLNDLEVSYKVLLGFGMTIVVDILKWES